MGILLTLPALIFIITIGPAVWSVYFIGPAVWSAINTFVMRYVIHPSDDGRFYLYDTLNEVIQCYCGNKILAEKVCRMMNQTALTDIGSPGDQDSVDTLH